jgi:hypothetical protein
LKLKLEQGAKVVLRHFTNLPFRELTLRRVPFRQAMKEMGHVLQPKMGWFYFLNFKLGG